MFRLGSYLLKRARAPAPQAEEPSSSVVAIHSPKMGAVDTPGLEQPKEFPFPRSTLTTSLQFQNTIHGDPALLQSLISSPATHYFSSSQYKAVTGLTLGEFFCERLDLSLDYLICRSYLFNELIFRLPFWAQKFLISVIRNPQYLLKHPLLFNIISQVPDICWTNLPGMIQSTETPLHLACLLLSTDRRFQQAVLIEKMASLRRKSWACINSFDLNMTPLHILFSSSEILWIKDHPALIERLCSLPSALWKQRSKNELGHITKTPLESLLCSPEGITLTVSHSAFEDLLLKLSEGTWGAKRDGLTALGLLMEHDPDNRVLTKFPKLDGKFQRFSAETLDNAVVHFTDARILNQAVQLGVFSISYPVFRRICFMKIDAILKYFKKDLFYKNGVATFELHISNPKDGSTQIIKTLVFKDCNILQNVLMNLFSVQVLAGAPKLLEKLCRLGEMAWAVKNHISEHVPKPGITFKKRDPCEWEVEYSRIYDEFRSSNFSNPFIIKRGLSAIQLICLPDLIHLLEIGKALHILAKMPLFVWGSVESQGFLKGTSPLSILMSQKRGLLLLSRESKLICYLMEMDDTGWISQGSYNQDSEISCLFSLCRDEVGIKLLAEHPFLLHRVLKLPGTAWNYVVQKGTQANTSALYWLCHHPSGRSLLARNEHFLLKSLISKVPAYAWTDVFLREGIGSRRSPLKWLEMHDKVGADLVKRYINDEPDSPIVSSASIAIS